MVKLIAEGFNDYFVETLVDCQNIVKCTWATNAGFSLLTNKISPLVRVHGLRSEYN